MDNVERASLPWSGYARENRFKLYFFDTGLLGALAGLAPAVFLKYGFGSYQGYFRKFRRSGTAGRRGGKTLLLAGPDIRD